MDKETEEFIRRVVSEQKPSIHYQPQVPRFRVILETLIAAGIVGLAARAYYEGVFQTNVTNALRTIKVELNAIQAKVQAPFPSDPPISGTQR